jgi:hypothetical protein
MITDSSADAKKPVFGGAAKLESVKRARFLMFEELDKTIGLAVTARGAPNFMIASALTAYTEYWGRLLTGTASGSGDACFTAFFEKMGYCYRALINNPILVKKDQKDGHVTHDVYKQLRGGLAHAYLIESSSLISLKRGSCGLEYDPTNGKYTFNVRTYLDDFKNAVNKYLVDLESGKADWASFERALENRPELI